MAAAPLPRAGLERLYQELRARFGEQRWWPADTAFEVLVGAVLTQNTAWRNVERAIAGLREAGLLSPEAIVAAGEAELAAAIRPSGYFNVKARRLRALCAAYLEDGGWGAWRAMETAALRERLLGVHGVGRETADDILLYAFHRPVFVVDAYTRRLFGRLGWVGGDEHYERLRAGVEEAWGADTERFNELHALIVSLGKDICRPRPRCPACPLAGWCPTGADAGGVDGGDGGGSAPS